VVKEDEGEMAVTVRRFSSSFARASRQATPAVMRSSTYQRTFAEIIGASPLLFSVVLARDVSALRCVVVKA
jgi:hypothetical protein